MYTTLRHRMKSSFYLLLCNSVNHDKILNWIIGNPQSHRLTADQSVVPSGAGVSSTLAARVPSSEHIWPRDKQQGLLFRCSVPCRSNVLIHTFRKGSPWLWEGCYYWRIKFDMSLNSLHSSVDIFPQPKS